MSSPPPLTDRPALLRHRARVLHAPETFLHDAVANEVHERLAEVNRAFTDTIVVSGYPRIAAKAFPAARVIADDDVLALDEGVADLIVHHLGLHWANDPVGQLVQCRRALRPDGLFIGTLFGGDTLSELRAALAEAEVALRGGLSPRVAPMAELRDLGGLLQRAGFALPVADSVRLNVRYRNMSKLLRDLRAMGETNALAARDKRIPPKQFFDRAELIYRAAHSEGQDDLPATFEVMFLTGWAPDASQPKPLRPGSATSRLADALNVEELPTGDVAGRDD